MKQEIKVGLAVVLTLVAVVLGVRFFEGLPVLSGTNRHVTYFESVDGLTAGNEVRVKGVGVGTVEGVKIDPESGRVQVNLRVNDDIRLTRGTTARVAGFAALGGVQLELVLGPPGTIPLRDGAEIPSAVTTSALSAFSDKAPLLAARLDTLMLGVSLTLGEVYRLVGEPDSDFRQSLTGLRQATNSLNAATRSASPRLDATLSQAQLTIAQAQRELALISSDLQRTSADFRLTSTEARGVTSDLRYVSASRRDSILVAVDRANTTLRRLDATFGSASTSAGRIDSIFARVERGKGNLGLLLNDSTLYLRLDTAAFRGDKLIQDFQRNPGRYLRHLDLIRVF